MTPLDQMTDAQLSEAFAVEVAGWEQDPEDGIWTSPNSGPCDGPAFANSADAVLPCLANGPAWAEFNKHAVVGDTITGKHRWRVRFKPLGVAGFIEGEGETFARAACIALLKAKRSQTASARPL